MYTEHYLSLVSKFPVILKHSNHHGRWTSYFYRQSLRIAFLAYQLMFNVSVTLIQECQVKNLPQEVRTVIHSPEHSLRIIKEIINAEDGKCFFV